jgi:glycosyltransferase involved in cell wall biosynthesis
MTGASESETIDLITTEFHSNPIDAAIFDNNSAIPTVLASKRVAPVQFFLQLGLPAWGALNLDAVFSGFGFDPQLGGWSQSDIYCFAPPWDLEYLRGDPDAAEIAQARVGVPQGGRVIGCYARLVKFTHDYLKAVERILLENADVCLLLGGNGDASEIEAFALQSPVGNRIFVHPDFVSGRAWARFLHLFLDTWPFQGGGSVREVLVCGVPVVSIRSLEMPALAEDRDPLLTVSSWDEFVAAANAMLQNDAVYQAAKERAFAVAHRKSDRFAFQRQFLSDLERTLTRSSTGADQSALLAGQNTNFLDQSAGKEP